MKFDFFGMWVIEIDWRSIVAISVAILAYAIIALAQ